LQLLDHPSAQSRSGGIVVSTTERGLPLALKLDPRELDKPPGVLAAEILALCRLSAVRAQVARRRELAGQNVDPSVIRNLQLANEEDLLRAERTLDQDGDVLPHSWMRSV
jgi:hypothetical protein